MKKILLFLYILYPIYNILYTPTSVFALTPSKTPTISPANEAKKPGFSIESQINDLKEKIASRVAQLKLVERRGVIGTVTDVSDTQITLSDLKDNIRLVDVDELTKFSSPSVKGTFGISDIAKGMTLRALGLYNKDSRRLLARFIDTVNPYIALSGTIISVDSENFTIKITTEGEKQYLIDIENITKTYSYTKEDGKQKSGFSKIQEGERIYVVGFLDIKSKSANQKPVTASRVLLFPDFLVNPKIQYIKQAVNPSLGITPSVGNGKKLTPITK